MLIYEGLELLCKMSKKTINYCLKVGTRRDIVKRSNETRVCNKF